MPADQTTPSYAELYRQVQALQQALRTESQRLQAQIDGIEARLSGAAEKASNIT